MPLLFTMSLFSTAERPDSPFSSVTWSRGALDNLLGQLLGVQGAQDKKKSKLYGKIGKQIITLCVPCPSSLCAALSVFQLLGNQNN
jgi:hypothetical protein